MLRLVAPPPLESERLMKAIADPASRALVASCVGTARSARALSALNGIPLTTVYRQLHRLQALGVVVVARSAMSEDGRVYDLYRATVESIHLVVDAHGIRVAWQPDPTFEASPSFP